MFFKRQSHDGAQWAAVSHEGGVATALAVSHTDPLRPRVDWVWQADSPTWADTLRLLTRASPWRGQRLQGVLARAQYKLVATEAPDVPHEEWRDALRWPLRDHVSFAVDDALIDVLAVPNDTAVRQTNPVIVCALSRQSYSDLELAADAVGLRWSSLDTVETALRNISALAEHDGSAHALMAFGQDHGVLVITVNGELVMSRQIDVPMSSLEGSDSMRDGALNRVALEVVRTIETFGRLHNQLSLSELSVLTPQHIGDEFITLLSEQVYVPVKACNLGDWFDLEALGDTSQKLARHASLMELALIGSLMRTNPRFADKPHLKLLDESSALTRDPAWGARLGLKLVAGSTALCLAAGVSLMVLQARAQARVHAAEHELPTLQQSVSGVQEPRVLKDLKELQARQAVKRELIEILQANAQGVSTGYSSYLMALGRQAHPSLWITGIAITGDAQDLEIRGRMLSPSVLPGYLQSLQAEPLFAGRRFGQIEVTTLGQSDERQGRVTEFILSTRLVSSKPVGEGVPAPTASVAARVPGGAS